MSVSRWIVSVMLASFQGVSIDAPLRLVGAIEIPAVRGRIDHLAVDLAHDRLFVAALGNDVSRLQAAVVPQPWRAPVPPDPKTPEAPQLNALRACGPLAVQPANHAECVINCACDPL